MSWKRLRDACVIGLTALIASACSVSRQAVKENTEQRVEHLESIAKVDSVVVAIRDTVREVTTITIRENEQGDTLRVTTVMNRERARERDRVRMQDVRVEVRTDTVFVERRDSVFVSAPAASATVKNRPAWVQGLKWIFWIIIAIGGLIIIFKVSKVFKFFV